MIKFPMLFKVFGLFLILCLQGTRCSYRQLDKSKQLVGSTKQQSPSKAAKQSPINSRRKPGQHKLAINDEPKLVVNLKKGQPITSAKATKTRPPLDWSQPPRNTSYQMIDAVLFGLYAMPRFKKGILKATIASRSTDPKARNLLLIQNLFKLFSKQGTFMHIPAETVRANIREQFVWLLKSGKQEKFRHVYKKLVEILPPNLKKRFGLEAKEKALVFSSTVETIAWELGERFKNPSILAAQGELGLLPSGLLSLPLVFEVAAKKFTGKDIYELYTVIWSTRSKIKILLKECSDLTAQSGLKIWHKIEFDRTSSKVTTSLLLPTEIEALLAKPKPRFFLYNRAKYTPVSMFSRIVSLATKPFMAPKNIFTWILNRSNFTGICKMIWAMIIKSGLLAAKFVLIVNVSMLAVNSLLNMEMAGSVDWSLAKLFKDTLFMELRWGSLLETALDYYLAEIQYKDKQVVLGVGTLSWAANLFIPGFTLLASPLTTGVNMTMIYRQVIFMIVGMILKFAIRFVTKGLSLSIDKLLESRKRGTLHEHINAIQGKAELVADSAYGWSTLEIRQSLTDVKEAMAELGLDL